MATPPTPTIDPTKTRSALEAQGHQYLGTMDKVTAAKKAGQNVQLIQGNYFVVPKPGAAPAPVNPTAPVAPMNPAPAPAAAPTNPQSATPPANVPAPATPEGDPLSRKYQEQLGNQYLGTMEAVNAAKSAGKDVQLIGNSYFVVNNKSFQTNQQTTGGALSRSALTAKGYKYIGTMDEVKAKKAAGENIQMLGGSYYSVPKPLVASADPGQTAPAPDTANPFTSGTSSSDARLSETAQLFPDIAEMMKSAPPEAIDLVKEYADLRRSQNMDALEGDLNAITKSLSDLDAAYTQGQQKVDGALSPMEVIRGEQGELQKQYLAQRDILVRDATLKQSILAQKQSVISTMMELEQKTYDNARQSYQDKFNNSMETAKFFEAKAESDRDYELQLNNQKRDDARANLSVVMSSITESGKNWSQLPATMKADIRKLELQSGLPVGTIESYAKSQPGAKLLTMVNGVDASGHNITSFIYADKNGNPGVTKTVRTGGVSKVPGSSDSSKLFTDSYTDNNGIVHKTFIDPDSGKVTDVVIGDKGPTKEQQQQAQQYETYKKRLENKDDEFSVSDLNAALKNKLIDGDVYTTLKAQIAEKKIVVPDVTFTTKNPKAKTGISGAFDGQSKNVKKKKNQ